MLNSSEPNNFFKKRILILATGGTIASKPTAAGMAPQYNIAQVLQPVSLLHEYYDITTEDLLQLDSSNIQVAEWQKIAAAIDAAKDKYDGIVVTHGTDTMAYTAAVLSYMLLGIKIPVVLTGSQFPVDVPLTDAHDNLRTAVAMAASKVPGVFLAFNRRIILGTRAVKVRTLDFQAFESINCPPLARVNSNGLEFDQVLLQQYMTLNRQQQYKLQAHLVPKALLIKLTPAFNAELLQFLPTLDYQALLIEAFGVGGVQFLQQDLINSLADLIKSGIAVVVSSQCLYERSNFSVYEVGRKLLDQGAIEAFDMTSEAAITKLYWLLGQAAVLQITEPQKRLAFVRKYFKENLVGEINFA